MTIVSDYQAPNTLEEAVNLLGAGDGARVLAGGTDLLVQQRSGAAAPAMFLDVKRIPDLMGLEVVEAGVLIGAAVPAAEIVECAEVTRRWPGLAEAVELIGSTQIQGRASLGGNLCNGSPAADTTPALIVLGAECRIVGPEGARNVPVEDFVTGPGQTLLRNGELLVALSIPSPDERSADAYLRLTPRTEMDIAIAGAGVSIALDEAGRCNAARIAIGAVAPTARRVPAAEARLIGSSLDESTLEQAGALASEASEPIDDKRSSASYRRRIIGVLVRRAFRRPRPAPGKGAESMRKHVEATVNGEPIDFLCEAGQSLLDVLRDELGLTGTKEGCGTGDCGACSVLVDDRLVPACLVLAPEAAGRRIETVEGLARGEELHPIQRKFLEHAALQCGICTPGILVATQALLVKKPDPSEQEVRYWLAGNLCRCTGYDKIVRAVLDVAQELQESGQPSQGEGA